jgi:hypothetical protein
MRLPRQNHDWAVKSGQAESLVGLGKELTLYSKEKAMASLGEGRNIKQW